MNLRSKQQSIEMSNIAITFFIFSELILLLFIFFDELTGFKGFMVKLMAIIFPVILIWLISERKKIIRNMNEKHYFVHQMRESFRNSQIPNNVRILSNLCYNKK